ncbi:MAG: geranylgeranyl reductase family protein [Rhodobacteraceae bacterium]|nr:geranylgeranyl reductase family protein [Paracoccaceae bacterium]
MRAAFDIDVLVAGLGPAGAAAAAAAAQAGARVLAVDRRTEPGLPVQCAEFVPMMLGVDTAAVSTARVQDIAAMDTYVREAAAEITPDFRGHMIDRAAFDAALVRAAEAAGATCRFATLIRDIAADGTVTLADGTTIRPRVLIGADGPRSLVGRAVGMPNTALVETRQITVDLLQPHEATDIFLRPEIEGGYGWLFPKGKLCNLGLGVVPSSKARLKPLLCELHMELVAQGRVGTRIHATTGGAIPVGGIAGLAARLGQTAVLLAGDAAGLVNPVTGAGINPAVLSGQMAGRAAAALVAGDTTAAEDYAEEAEDLFGPSIALALRRRREVLAAYAAGQKPDDAALRRGWIAYSDYWDRTTAPAHDLWEAREPA